jgi:hypothetical protein
MTNKHTHSWIGIYTESGKLLRIDCRHCTDNRSFGRAAKANRIELRAARLAGAETADGRDAATRAEIQGYSAHLNGDDPRSAAEWAGWLEREILVQGAPSKIDEDALIAALAHCPDREPPADFKERVIAAIDEAEQERCVDEQTRHDVAASVARHAELDSVDQSEPVPAPEATLRDVNTDEEPTHVGDVDARFDSTEVEP